MFVAAIEFDVHIPQSRSLKEKRAAIKPILEGARNRFGVSSAEVEHQDQWQRAGLAIAAVGSSPGHVEEVLDAVERFVWSFPEVEVLGSDRQWLEES